MAQGVCSRCVCALGWVNVEHEFQVWATLLGSMSLSLSFLKTCRVTGLKSSLESESSLESCDSSPQLCYFQHTRICNQTSLNYSSFSVLVRFVRAGETAAIALGAHQKRTKQAYAFENEPWSGLFGVRTRSDLKQTQLQFLD